MRKGLNLITVDSGYDQCEVTMVITINILNRGDDVDDDYDDDDDVDDDDDDCDDDDDHPGSTHHRPSRQDKEEPLELLGHHLGVTASVQRVTGGQRSRGQDDLHKRADPDPPCCTQGQLCP